jgi:glycosyltransferase involved in cell wall biosynthesis
MADGPASKRLLFATPFPPRLDGDHGGSRTIAQLLSALAERYEIGLLYLRTSDEPDLDSALAARCAWAEAVPRPGPRDEPFGPPGRKVRLLLGLLRGRPAWVSRWAVPDYARRLQERARTWAPSVVQLEFHVMGQYLDALEDCPAPRVLVEHEPGAPTAGDRCVHARGPERLVAWADLRAWERFEPAVLLRVQAVVVFTERDRASVAALAPKTPVTRIPLGTSVPPGSLDPLGGEPPTLLFVGNYVHPPNVDAAVRLATAILPLVLERHPDARLHLVGPHPPPVVRRLANAAVAVTGGVPDVTPYLDRAAVVVVPLRLGGGMRVKLIEALAAGKAVVASSRAVEGLDLTDGDQLRLAETDADFASAIAELLADPVQRRALAGRARAWSSANVGWDRVASAYEALYQSLTGATRSS